MGDRGAGADGGVGAQAVMVAPLPAYWISSTALRERMRLFGQLSPAVRDQAMRAASAQQQAAIRMDAAALRQAWLYSDDEAPA